MSHQRGLTTGRRVGKPDPGHLVVLPFPLETRQQFFGAFGHVLSSNCLGGFGPHPICLGHQLRRLAFRIQAFPLAALLVGLPLLQITFPIHRVEIQLGAVGVQVEHLVHDRFEQTDVVADHHQTASEALQISLQPGYGIRIEMVGGLIQQEGVGVGEQDPGQLNPTSLTTRKSVERLPEDTLRKPKVSGDPSRFRLGSVSSRRQQRVLGPGVGSHGLLPRYSLRGAHLLFGPPETHHHLIQPARTQYPITRKLLWFPRAGILRQVTDLPGTGDDTSRWQPFPSKYAGQCCLPCTVATHQTDAIPSGDLKTDRGQQEPCTRTHLHILDLQHVGEFYLPTAEDMIRSPARCTRAPRDLAP